MKIQKIVEIQKEISNTLKVDKENIGIEFSNSLPLIFIERGPKEKDYLSYESEDGFKINKNIIDTMSSNLDLKILSILCYQTEEGGLSIQDTYPKSRTIELCSQVSSLLYSYQGAVEAKRKQDLLYKIGELKKEDLSSYMFALLGIMERSIRKSETLDDNLLLVSHIMSTINDQAFLSSGFDLVLTT